MKAHKNDLKRAVLTVKEAQEKLSEEEFKEIAQDVFAELILEELTKKGLKLRVRDQNKIFRLTKQVSR